MTSKELGEIVDLDFPDTKITEETKLTIRKHGRRYLINDVRLAMGRFYSDEEYEKMRKKILSTPLP